MTMSSINSISVEKIEVITNNQATYGVVTLSDKRKLKVEVMGGDDQMVKLNMNEISQMAIQILIEQNILQANPVGRFLSAEIDERQTTVKYEKDTETHEHFISSEKVNRLFTLILLATESPTQKREKERQERVEEDKQKEQRNGQIRKTELEATQRKQEQQSQAIDDDLEDLQRYLYEQQLKKEKEKELLRTEQEKELENEAVKQNGIKIELIHEDGSSSEIPVSQPKPQPQSQASFFSRWMPSFSSLTSYLEI